VAILPLLTPPVGPNRAAMVEIDEDLQPARYDVVRFWSLDVGDETDTARIMLVAQVIKTLSFLQSHRRMLFTQAVGASSREEAPLTRQPSRRLTQLSGTRRPIGKVAA
jgi:hypothetical protein